MASFKGKMIGMEKSLTKKTMFFSIGSATIILILSISSAVSYQAVLSSQTRTNSPLFHLRLEKIIDNADYSSFVPSYIGKDKPVQIFLPNREIFTEDIFNQLSSNEIKEQILLINPELSQKWDDLLVYAKNNIAGINREMRQNYNDYQLYTSRYSLLSKQEAQSQLIDLLKDISFEDFEQNMRIPTQEVSSRNITTGPLCNITSGQFCQITSQPICQITTQPICSLTRGFFCWTIYGPICPTTGIKCHPPTTRPTICTIFAAAGKILKSVILVLLLATVIFVPLGILSLVFITISNPDRCDQIHEKITMWFNCSTPR